MHHPIYGSYQAGWRTIPYFSNYEINELCHVRNATTKRIIKPTTNFQVSLVKSQHPSPFKTTSATRRSSIRVYHLGLMSFFPHIKPLETIDHIDECRNNHHISNLQWLSNRDNAIKSNRLRPRKRKIDDTHRYIQQRSPTSGIVLQEFTPIELKNENFSLAAVKKCMAGVVEQYSNFHWTIKSNDDLPDEEWKTSDALKNRLAGKKPGGTPIPDQTIDRIRVSNRGRILHANGRKSFGCKLLYSIYRRAFSVYMHILVWDVWGDRKRSPGEYILHDDSQPRDSQGCVSNDIRFLRLGTQRENMIEWHTQKRRQQSLNEGKIKQQQ